MNVHYQPPTSCFAFLPKSASFVTLLLVGGRILVVVHKRDIFSQAFILSFVFA